MATLLDITEKKSMETASRNTAKRYFQVRYDDPDVSAVEVLTAVGLPDYDDEHPDDADLTVDDKYPRRVGKSGLWLVEVPYKIKTAELGGDNALSPLDRPVQDFSFPLTAQIEVDTDRTEMIIQNSAGQPVKVPMQWADYGLRFVKNLDVPRDDNLSTYFMKTNNAVWKGFAVGRVLCLGISQDYAEEIYRGTQVVYYRTTYNFAVAIERFATSTTYWQARFLDEGVAQKDAGNQVIPMVDPLTGKGFGAPMLLDGAGLKAPANAAANWIEKTVYGSIDFNSLPI